MTRTITIEKTLYTYDELSPAAKERAQEKFNTFEWESGSAQERMEEIANGILEEKGFEATDDLTYQLYSQGGYPVFSTRGVFEHEGTKYLLTVGTQANGGSSYSFYPELFQPDGEELSAWGEKEKSADRAARSFLHSLSVEIHRAMVAEDEYLSSDERIRDLCEANGYEFDEHGTLA